MGPQAVGLLDRQAASRLAQCRWLAFGIALAGFVLAFFHRQVPATLSGELQRAFQASGTELGVLAAAYFYTYTALQIPVGVITDVLGARRAIAWGAAIAGLGSLLFGLAHTLLLCALGRFLVGLGVSSMFLSLLNLISQWFPADRFSTLNGVALLIGNAGSVLAATPLALLISVVSWRAVFVGLGLFSILLALLAGRYIYNRPEEVGLPSMRALAGLPPYRPAHSRWQAALRQVLANPLTWPAFLPNLGIIGSMFAFVGLWAVPYLRDVYGMDRTVATYHTSLLLVGFAVGGLLNGVLSDQLQRRLPVILAGATVYTLCWLPLAAGWRLPTATGYLVFFLMGIGASSITVSWASVREANIPASSGMAVGVVNTGTFLGTALLQPLAGWLMDRAWQGTEMNGMRIYSITAYQWGFAGMGVFILAGWVSAWFIRETRCRYLTA